MSLSYSVAPLRRPVLTRPLIMAAHSRCLNVSASKVTRESAKVSPAISNRQKSQQTQSEAMKMGNAQYFKSGAMPLFPSTFVSAPLSEYPKSPSSFLAYHWARTKHWLTGTISVLNIKLQSMDTWTTRPRFKAQRGRIAPTAKVMYHDVLQAFATGDRSTIRDLCTPSFADKLTGAIERRPKTEGVRFELTRYNRTLIYPRLMSHVISEFNPYDRLSLTEQAIVAVSSTQQMSRYNVATGETIPSTTRIQDKIEYVVLMRNMHAKTYETTPWQIWGTTTATTLERAQEQQAAIEKEQIRRAGWKDLPSQKK